jgi:hypothetical protein
MPFHPADCDKTIGMHGCPFSMLECISVILVSVPNGVLQNREAEPEAETYLSPTKYAFSMLRFEVDGGSELGVLKKTKQPVA